MLRRRLDRIEGHAHDVMSDTERTLAQARNVMSHTERHMCQLAHSMATLVALLTQTVREINDGIPGTLRARGELLGMQVATLDVDFALKLLEDGDEPPATEPTAVG